MGMRLPSHPPMHVHPRMQPQVTYLEDCGYKHSPSSFEDLTPLLKQEIGIQETCICNPGLVLLSSDDKLETWLISFKIYKSVDGSTCVSSSVSDFPGVQGCKESLLLLSTHRFPEARWLLVRVVEGAARLCFGGERSTVVGRDAPPVTHVVVLPAGPLRQRRIESRPCHLS